MAGWDDNWDESECAGKLVKRVRNQLRLAMSEKFAALELPLPATIFEMDTFNVAFEEWTIAFHASMNFLMTSQFFNHTQEFINTDDAVENWTIATLLNHLDQPYISAPTDPQIARPWYYQQKQILDLLIWTKEELTADHYFTGQSKSVSGHPTYAAAVAAFNAQAFGPSFIIFGAYFESRLVGGTYSISIDDAPILFQANEFIKHDTDIVGRTISAYSGLGWFDIGTTTWIDPDGFGLPEIWQNAFTLEEQILNATVTTDFILEQWRGVNETPPEPVGFDYDVDFDTTGVSEAGFILRKFDSENGFEFRATVPPV